MQLDYLHAPPQYFKREEPEAASDQSETADDDFASLSLVQLLDRVRLEMV
jgi:hypothetical protein